MTWRRLSGRRGVIAAVAALALGAIAGCGSGSGGDAYAAEEMASGDEVSIESLRGSPALLVSWATWCRECAEELAGLAEFADSPQAEGIRIVAVNIDAADVTEEIDAKIAASGLDVEMWRDRSNDFKAAFGALGVPTTVLLDADGEMVDLFAGAIDFDDTEVLDALERVRNS